MLPWYRLAASRKIVVVVDVVAPCELVFIVSLKHVPTYVTVAKKTFARKKGNVFDAVQRQCSSSIYPDEGQFTADGFPVLRW